jgi:hypothetical protein
MLCWLLKDLGWAATCWPLAVPAAVSSFIFQSFGLFVAFLDGGLRSEDWVYRGAMLGWIVGNATWMMSEFLFEALKEPSRHFFFWNHGPILHVSSIGYNWGLLATRLVLFSTLTLLVFYLYRRRNAARARESRGGGGLESGKSYEVTESEEVQPLLPAATTTVQSRDPIERLLPQDLFHIFFVTIWIVKDVFWTYELLAGALVAAILLVTLSLNNLARRGFTDPGMQISELLWVFGNTAWVISEVWDGDAHTWPRFGACLLLLGGCVVASVNLCCVQFVPGLRTAMPSDEKVLCSIS